MMKTKIILIKLFLSLIFLQSLLVLAQDKVASCYIIQQLSPNIYHYSPFYSCNFKILSWGEYYIADKKEILNFIREDTVYFNNLKMIIDVSNSLSYQFSVWDSVENKKPFSNYRTGIFQILDLQDSEIYKIGKQYYVLRKVKYAYNDTLKVFGKWFEVAAYIYGDDNPIHPFDKSYASLNEILKTNEYQIFYYLIELLPTEKSISKHVWKRKYELDRHCK